MCSYCDKETWQRKVRLPRLGQSREEDKHLGDLSCAECWIFLFISHLPLQDTLAFGSRSLHLIAGILVGAEWAMFISAVDRLSEGHTWSLDLACGLGATT